MQDKSLIFLLLCLACSNASCADYDVANLQKLFTDKKQRAQIDAVRSGNNAGPELKKANKINILGYVTRTDGKNAAWVNDGNTITKTRLGNINVYQSSIGKNKKVTVSVAGQTKRLKPGESWLIETGRVIDSHE